MKIDVGSQFASSIDLYLVEVLASKFNHKKHKRELKEHYSTMRTQQRHHAHERIVHNLERGIEQFPMKGERDND